MIITYLSIKLEPTPSLPGPESEPLLKVSDLTGFKHHL